jgi:hypothetical protein
MYFSLPEYIPPHPLGGTRVRKQWSALYYFIAHYNIDHVEVKTHNFVYVDICYSYNKYIQMPLLS